MSKRNYPSPRTSDLRALADRKGPVISLYLPVTAAVPGVEQNALRHARVVRAGLSKWKEFGADAHEVERAAKDLESFSTESTAPEPAVKSRAAFWSLDQGVSVFGLPFECEESAVVASCAALRPILRAANRPQAYRVLAVSANQVALFEGDEDRLTKLKAPGLPESLEAALGKELSDPSVHAHSTGRGGSRPVYHGQGGAPRARQVDLAKFYQHVARGLAALLPDDRLALVLAADATHLPELKKVLGPVASLLDTPVTGNVEHMSESELHRATWSIVVGSRTPEADVAGRDRPPVTQISEVVKSAVMGRIRSLHVPETGTIAGRVDRNRAAAVEAWGDDDLIDELSVEVLRRGGSVEVLEGMTFSSSDTGLAAELR